MPLFRNDNSYTRRTALITSGRLVVGSLVFILIILVLLLRALAPGLLSSLATPVWGAGQAATDTLASFMSIFGNGAELTKERDRLSVDNLAFAEENRTLRGQLADLAGLTASSTLPSGIRTGVLARPPVAPYDTLVIGAGADDGIAPGAYVYGPGSVPLGTIDSVTARTARVALYSTGGRATDGWAGDKRIPITLMGRGAGAFEATMPRDSGVKVSDVLYVPGPGALPIGTVVRVSSDPASPRDEILIAPYANLFSLTWVAVARRVP